MVVGLLTSANATPCDYVATDDIANIHLRIRRLGVRISPSAPLSPSTEPQTSGNRLFLPRQAGSPQNRVGQKKLNSKLRNILY
jgi:hypothetical protein